MNPKAYTRVLNLDDSSGEKGIEEEQTMWFIGLNFDKSFPMNIDLTEEIKHFITLGKSVFYFFASFSEKTLNSSSASGRSKIQRALQN